MGGMSCTWCVLWIVLVQDSPLQQPYIDQEERDFLMEALGTKPKGTTKVIFIHIVKKTKNSFKNLKLLYIIEIARSVEIGFDFPAIFSNSSGAHMFELGLVHVAD